MRLSPRDIFGEEYQLYYAFAHFQAGRYAEAAAAADRKIGGGWPGVSAREGSRARSGRRVSQDGAQRVSPRCRWSNYSIHPSAFGRG